jgi:hypothetical protein
MLTVSSLPLVADGSYVYEAMCLVIVVQRDEPRLSERDDKLPKTLVRAPASLRVACELVQIVSDVGYHPGCQHRIFAGVELEDAYQVGLSSRGES